MLIDHVTGSFHSRSNCECSVLGSYSRWNRLINFLNNILCEWGIPGAGGTCCRAYSLLSTNCTVKMELNCCERLVFHFFGENKMNKSKNTATTTLPVYFNTHGTTEPVFLYRAMPHNFLFASAVSRHAMYNNNYIRPLYYCIPHMLASWLVSTNICILW